MAPRNPKSKTVFILGGGASLGAHQAGSIRRLEELGICPDVILGSSIGVVNACLYAMGGVGALEEGWSSFHSLRSIINFSLRHNLLVGKSIFSQRKLHEQVERRIDFPKIFAGPLEIEFILINISRGEACIRGNRTEETWQDFRTLSRCGYAIPLLFPPIRYKGDYWVDGAFAWNIPLTHVIQNGATDIYILSLFGNEMPYQKSFKNILDVAGRFHDFMWRSVMNAGYLQARIRDGRYQGVPVTVIDPSEVEAGFNPLDLLRSNPKRSRRLMEIGYMDAKRAIARRGRLEEKERRARTARGTQHR